MQPGLLTAPLIFILLRLLDLLLDGHEVRKFFESESFLAHDFLKPSCWRSKSMCFTKSGMYNSRSLQSV